MSRTRKFWFVFASLVAINVALWSTGTARAGGGGKEWKSFGGIQIHAPLTLSCPTVNQCVICKVKDATVHCAHFSTSELP